MARTRMSRDGAVVIPKSVRDAHGWQDGAEFEVIDGGKQLVLRVIQDDQPESQIRKKLTTAEFLASIPLYDGPPVTIEMMDEAVLEEAARDWKRLERQWRNEDADD